MSLSPRYRYAQPPGVGTGPFLRSSCEDFPSPYKTAGQIWDSNDVIEGEGLQGGSGTVAPFLEPQVPRCQTGFTPAGTHRNVASSMHTGAALYA